MSILLNTYSSLLTDISRLVGIQLDLPDALDENWVLVIGPQLDKTVLTSLENEGLTSPLLPHWLLPLWLRFISTRDSLALKCLRTVLVFGYKAEFEPTEIQLVQAQSVFESANNEVGAWNVAFSATPPGPLFREAKRLVSRVIARCDWFKIVPSHGPGSVFPTFQPSDKGNFDVYTDIVQYYPYDQYFNGLHESGLDDLKSDYHPVDHIHCKMVAVPKDSRGPRLISVHPKESIWIQQGQRHVLEQAIEHHPLTSGRINFRDQKVNGAIALSSSEKRDYVTIDLKEASDRIGRGLVDYLFGYSSKILSCTRASHVVLLDKRLVELNMWAPMGNCLTFPVESLTFWAMVRAGILCRHGVSCDDIYVFGDDIIVPTPYYEGAIYGLLSAGLIPNYTKTFRKGFFRESCGVDAYCGKDVTPFRLRVRDINTYSDGESVCDLAKRLVMAGFTDTSTCLYRAVQNAFGRLSMTNNPNCSGLVRYCDCDLGELFRYEPRLRFSSRYHTWVVPYRRLEAGTTTGPIDSWWNLQDSLLRIQRSWMPVTSSDRGLEYLLPRRERLVRGYVDCIFLKKKV